MSAHRNAIAADLVQLHSVQAPIRYADEGSARVHVLRLRGERCAFRRYGYRKSVGFRCDDTDPTQLPFGVRAYLHFQ